MKTLILVWLFIVIPVVVILWNAFVRNPNKLRRP